MTILLSSHISQTAPPRVLGAPTIINHADTFIVLVGGTFRKYILINVGVLLLVLEWQ